MNSALGLSLAIISVSIFTISRANKTKSTKSLISRFKRRLKRRNVLKERLNEEFVNSLVTDPEANISIGTWYSEEELREKADIHRTRLSKFGKSKMNGEMLFLEANRGVYKLTPEGKRKYV